MKRIGTDILTISGKLQNVEQTDREILSKLPVCGDLIAEALCTKTGYLAPFPIPEIQGIYLKYANVRHGVRSCC